MIRILVVVAGLIALPAAFADCPSARLLPDLDKAFHHCNNRIQDGSCERFVSLYEQLVPEYDCRTGPKGDLSYPAINDADMGAYMDYLSLLADLAAGRNKKFANKAFASAKEKAEALFASEAFAGTLVGGPAEQYGDLIYELRRRRQK